MKIGFKRLEEHGEKAISFLDPRTSRGFILHYSNDWTLMLNDAKKHDNESMLDYISNNGFIPREVQQEEFDKFYHMCSTSKYPIFESMDQLNLSEVPSIKKIVEESKAQYESYIEDIINKLR